MRAALSELPSLPLLLWTFSPEASLPRFLPFQRMIQGSGAVCTLQLSGMLKRERRWFRAVAGPLEDELTYRRIGGWARAMAVARRLDGLRVGVLPFRCDQMSTTYVDEFELRRLYGVELATWSWSACGARRRGSAPGSWTACGGRWRQGGARVRVDPRNLEEGLRYALALAEGVGEAWRCWP